MKPEKSKTLHKQADAALRESEERFCLVAVASEPERLVPFPKPIQDHFILLTIVG